MQDIFAGIIFITSLTVAGFSYWFVRKFKNEAKNREEEVKRRMYELAILKEVGDRIGYSLNLKKVVDIITGSLPQFIKYSTASYMLLDPEKILFKTELQEPVSKEFVDEVKKRMFESLSAMLNKDLSNYEVEEVVTGAISGLEVQGGVKSFFNIPLIVDTNVVGVITVANTRDGLYDEDEMTLLYQIVGQASQAITRLEEVIRTERGKLGAMVESMTDGVVMTNKDYRIIVANPEVKHIIGVKDKEEVTIFDFIDKLGKKFDIRGKLEESVKLGKVFTEDDIEINGRIFQILTFPVKGKVTDKEEIFGGVVIFRDTTHIKEVEKMREDFTSMMVHELRTPLDGIKKMGELMRSDQSIKNDEKTYNEYLSMMYKSASGMLELVNDLLDVAKIESGKFDIRKKSSDLRKIVNDRIMFFDPLAKDAKIELSTVFGADIPHSVEVDPVRIAQVINNLLSNAIKFTGNGGRVTVQTIVHKNGIKLEDEAKESGVKWLIQDSKDEFKKYPDALFVAVTDTGNGVSKEDKNKLFNKFTQLKAASTTEKRGTGLGLVVAKGIIEAHGGIIGVSSEEGVGSTFYFTIKI
jgi:signal transduction histidine kinase